LSSEVAFFLPDLLETLWLLCAVAVVCSRIPEEIREMGVTFRTMAKADASTFLALRLISLLGRPTAFDSSTEEEATTLVAIENQLGGSDAQVFFGVFDGAQLVGTIFAFSRRVFQRASLGRCAQSLRCQLCAKFRRWCRTASLHARAGFAVAWAQEAQVDRDGRQWARGSAVSEARFR
jgi:hypothetical protein